VADRSSRFSNGSSKHRRRRSPGRCLRHRLLRAHVPLSPPNWVFITAASNCLEVTSTKRARLAGSYEGDSGNPRRPLAKACNASPLCKKRLRLPPILGTIYRGRQMDFLLSPKRYIARALLSPTNSSAIWVVFLPPRSAEESRGNCCSYCSSEASALVQVCHESSLLYHVKVL